MRRLLIGAFAALLVILLGLAVAAVVVYSRADVSTVGELSFSQRLRVPPLLEPPPDSSGRKVFDLTLEQGQTELLPGEPTDTWGVNGAYLGPTLRASRGDTLLMRVRNELPETTTLHWHGMHLPGGGRRWSAPGD
jgi:FtsP/CotA-like multicopper oxidase with cupredoxin domain